MESDMRKLRIVVTGIGLTLLPTAGSVAEAAARVVPHLEVQQVFDADLSGDGDSQTYSAIAAGIDASVAGPRTEGQISYRYERRIPWNDNFGTEDVHSGLARGRADVIPNLLSVDGGAIALRTRSDIRGGAPVFLTGDDKNTTQVYGFYGGPSLDTRAGPLKLGANYRFGYVKVKDHGSFVLPNGQPALDRFDHATNHDVDVSIAMPSGDLPFAWTVTAGYTRENASQLDQRFVGKYVRNDVVFPVSPTLALTGGIGYEDIKVTERAALRDSNGVPILSGSGRFITDPDSPRLIAYQTDGLIWDVGAIWKPNRRTTIEGRFGRRYGGRAVTGSLDYKLSRRTAVRVAVYDAIDSFGRSLTRGLGSLPTSFNVNRNPLTGDFSGCIFGSDPGTGGCLDDTLQSISTANYRSRGVVGMLSGERGPWTFGVGAGYANHKYLTPRSAALFSVDGIADESVYTEANATRRLSSVSGVTGSVFANWYNSGINRAPSVSDIGATASYYRNFTDHLVGQVSAGVYNTHVKNAGNSAHAQAVVSLRYQF